MSQEYTEDKDVTLKKLSSGRRLLEAVLILVAIFAIYLMVALVSFNPSDPSWSQTAWHEPIHNLGGGVGAWLADTLFFTFGVLAYAVPPIMLALCWAGFRQRDEQNHIDYFALSLRLIGTLALILTSCGLAALNVDDLYYFASGGVLGSLLSSAMVPWFNGVGATLSLLCVWAVGLTLFTGWSWLTIAEKLGGAVLGSLAFLSNRSRHEQHESEYAADERAQADSEEAVADAAMQIDDAVAQDDVLFSAPSLNTLRARADDEGSVDVEPESAVTEQPLSEEADAVSETAGAEPAVMPPTESLTPVVTSGVSAVSAPVEAVVESTPPLYRFEIPGTAAPASAVQLDDDEPRMGNWQALYEPQAPALPAHRPAEAVVISKAAEPVVAFMPALSATGDDSLQIKQGIGPELPRPNPVRIPTRRELASYGIKLPSQRRNEVEEANGDDACSAEESLSAEQIQQQQELQEAALRQAFVEQQQARYRDQDDAPASCQPEPAKGPSTSFSLDTPTAYTSSPMADLVDDGPDEPMFTPSPQPDMPQQSPAAALHQWQPPVVPVQASQQQPEPATPAVSAAAEPAMDSLIHPFLMRNDRPLHKPTTPLPTLDLLASPPAEEEPVDMFALEQTARLVEARLGDYRVKAEVVGISPGPVITRYELDLAPGVKAARISNLARDLARSLSTVAVRVVDAIPGKPYVGLELPNKHRQTVYLREVLDCAKFRENTSPLAIVLGKDIAGQPVVADLAKMPHLLVAGTTGSGKSVGVNAMILSMLYKATPEDVRFIMIDPKMLELSVYEGIPHLLTEVVTDMKDAANALRWCVNEMERRYKLMSALGVRNLAGYNERVQQAEAMGRPVPDPFWKPGDSMDIIPPVLEKLPYIVVMVDEFADLMMAVGKKVEELIARLAQKARAAGIHLVLATQRPSVDVITGLIKANIPTRIAFTVSSKIDSRTILDQGGAESLLGMGDMLYMAPNSTSPIRVHGAFVRDQEVHAVVQDWKARGRPQYIDSILSASEEGEGGSMGLDNDEELDPLFDQAVAFVVDKRRASISGVQRQFRIGYNRAARIIEQMEAQGIVSPQGHNGNREVLAPPSHE